MKKTFPCPYCFEEIREDKVLFRFKDLDLIKAINEEFVKYEERLDREGKSLEDNPFAKEAFCSKTDQVLLDWWGVDQVPLERDYPVLDPREDKVARYLVKSDQDSLLYRDEDNFVDCIRINSAITVKQPFVRDRVCPHCHNGLPDGYGKYDTKKIAVIGTTGAGKTVYLSKLLEQLKSHLIRWGISANHTASGARFIAKNLVRKGEQLPDSTPYKRPQEPIYYELDTRVDGSRERQGLLIYDIAGENFADDKIDAIKTYGNHLLHADAFVVLLDPLQFPNIAKSEGEMQSIAAQQAITAISGIVKGNSQHVDKPIAVCITKIDLDTVQNLFADTQEVMSSLSSNDYGYRKNNNGQFRDILVATDYNVVCQATAQMIMQQDLELHNRLLFQYSNFNYFALTSLGCSVENGCPIAEVEPRRILDPILWLFSHFGYVRVEGELYSPANRRCPFCDSIQTEEKVGERETGRGFLAGVDHLLPSESFLKRFGVTKETTNFYCNTCKEPWYQEV